MELREGWDRAEAYYAGLRLRADGCLKTSFDSQSQDTCGPAPTERRTYIPRRGSAGREYAGTLSSSGKCIGPSSGALRERRAPLPQDDKLVVRCCSALSLHCHVHPSHTTSLHFVILSAVFRPAKQDESKRRTYAFLAPLLLRVHHDQPLKDSGIRMSWTMPRSFVGSPSPREGLRFLRMTILRTPKEKGRLAPPLFYQRPIANDQRLLLCSFRPARQVLFLLGRQLIDLHAD